MAKEKKIRKILSKHLPQKRFAKNVSLLIGGTAGGQLLMILMAPLLTRLYDPQDFGLLVAFLAILSIISVVAAGRYELAIVIPKSDKLAADVLVLSLLCVAVSAFLVFIAQFYWAENISLLLNAPGLSDYLWLMPVGVICSGFYQTFQKWGIREKDFATIAKTKIWQAISISSIQVAFYKLGAFSLIGGQAVGQGVGVYKLAQSAFRSNSLPRTKMSDILAAGKEYKEFPLLSTWSALLNTASLQLAPILIISFYGASAAGLYALTHRVLAMPAGLIGNAVGSVFLSESPEAQRRGDLAQLTSSINKKLSIIGVIPLFLILALGPLLFSLVFGDDWRDAGVYAQWIAVWLYFQFQWSPISMIAITLQLHRQLLIVQVLSIFFRIGSLTICYYRSEDVLTAISVFSIISALSYLARSAYFLNKAGVNIVGPCLSMVLIFILSVTYLVSLS